jgi:hypothetical protein
MPFEDVVCTFLSALPRSLEQKARHDVLDASHSGGDIDEAIPDPIPNSEVKLVGADGTARVILWESRTLPGLSCWTRNPPRFRASEGFLLLSAVAVAERGARKDLPGAGSRLSLDVDGVRGCLRVRRARGARIRARRDRASRDRRDSGDAAKTPVRPRWKDSPGAGFRLATADGRSGRSDGSCPTRDRSRPLELHRFCGHRLFRTSCAMMVASPVTRCAGCYNVARSITNR